MAKRKTSSTQKLMRSLEAKDFYSDFSAEGMLHAALVRSPASSGVVKEVRILDMDEGYYLFTAKDIPHNKSFTINGSEIPVFTHGKVMYRGEPLGIICGPDKEKVLRYCNEAEVIFDIGSLESAFQSIEKNYKRPVTKISGDLDSLVNELNNMPDLDEVNSSKHPDKNSEDDFGLLAHREIKTGLFTKSSTDADEPSPLSDIWNDTETYSIFEDSWTQSFTDPLWAETTGAFCYSEKDILHVYTTTKWSYLLLNVISECLDIPSEKIYIHKTKTSGPNSNGIWRNAKVAAQTALASRLTGKPVRLIFSHEEQSLYMSPGVGTKINYKTAVETATSRIKAMEVSIDVDVGARNPFADEIIDRLSIACTNIYTCENLHITAKAVSSPNPPTSIYAKTVDSQSFFAAENHISKISTALHQLPDTMRLINFKTPCDNFPFKTSFPNAGLCIESVMKNSDFNRRFITYGLNAESRMSTLQNPFFALPLRGMGLACAYYGSGYFGKNIFSGEQKMEVTLLEDQVVIHTPKPSEAVENMWKKIVDRYLQIDASKVVINSEYLYNEIPNIPEETSSSISVMTNLLEKCCAQIAKKRFHEPLPINVKKSVSPSLKKAWNLGTFSGTPFNSTSFAACALELEVDSYTYAEKIKNIYFCIDCGEVFDKKAAERNVKHAIQIELSNMVENETVVCDNISISFIQSKSEPAQIGELVHNTLPAAFSSALSLALNTHLTELPCTQNLIYSLIQERNKDIQKQAEKEDNPAAETTKEDNEQ